MSTQDIKPKTQAPKEDKKDQDNLTESQLDHSSEPDGGSPDVSEQDASERDVSDSEASEKEVPESDTTVENQGDINANPNHQDQDDEDEVDEKYSKTINLVSFGFTNGKPRASDDDTVISVRDMFNVEKRLRDNHNGTSTELQRALMDMEANKERYDEILEELKPDLTDMINTDDDEEITIYVGCEVGKHRSVAVVSLMFKDLPEILKKLPIKNRKNKEIHMNIEHRDLERNGFRKNKKNLEQDRSRRRDKKSRGFTGGHDY